MHLLLLFFTVQVATYIDDVIKYPWLLWHYHIHTKTNVKIIFGLRSYVKKDNKITFLIQLVSYQNSSEINKNYQNSMLTVAMSMMT
jgi:hypothetical protein